MDIQAEKLDLIQWMAQLTDEHVIEQIKALRGGRSKTEEKEEIALSAAHRKILDDRLRVHRENPESGSSWKDVRQRVTSVK